MSFLYYCFTEFRKLWKFPHRYIMNIIDALRGVKVSDTVSMFYGYIDRQHGIEYWVENDASLAHLRGYVHTFLDEYIDDFWILLQDTAPTCPPTDREWSIFNIANLSFYGLVKAYVEVRLQVYPNPFGDHQKQMTELMEVVIYQYIRHCNEECKKQALSFLEGEPIRYDHKKAEELFTYLVNENVIQL